MVGLLHSMIASGRPFTKATTSGMTCFFGPRTLYCRVTIHSLRVGVVEVEEPDRVALASVAAVLLQGDAVGERGVEGLVGLSETGGRDLGDRPYGLGEVGSGEPGVQPAESQGEAAGQDGLLEARTLAFEVFRRDVGVAEGLQQLGRGALC